MKVFKDFQGLSVRLTDERLKHILAHPEMNGMIDAVKNTLADPEKVIQSLSDSEAHLYYRFYFGTKVGNKHLCVVVKIKTDDAFVLTAYLTDSIKKGQMIWPKRK